MTARALTIGVSILVVGMTATTRTQTSKPALPTAKPTAATASAKPLGIGRAATPEEIRAVDIDVMPDGHGLPPGRGTVAEGAATYAAKCQSCHGAKGQGGSFDRLVGRDPNVKTIGNYWPYATTIYDYTARSMPFQQPGSLTPNEVYGLVAYLLNLNEIVPEDAVMDQTSLPKVVMPGRDKFVRDNRTGGPVVK
jgi:S-disulfanyl-L-cysteine oxidoreductase SoxD